jgi:sterol desaturase/sphingolipid hydroxylase (fatty acid hydroxylase superfamily)
MVAAGFFPVTLAACLAIAWSIAAAGWPPALQLVAPVPAAIACWLAERRRPHDRAWRPHRADVVTDATHAVFSQLGGGIVGGLLVLQLARFDVAVWPVALPVAAQLALVLLIGELAQYAWHRGAHAVLPLWRVHATHHSSPRLYWLAGARFHPLEVIVLQVASFGPVAIAGAPPEVLALASVASTVVGTLQHANVEMRLGPLDWIFAGPRLHRWHHAIELAHQRGNSGGTLIVWDIVFGTRRAPPASPPRLGLATAFPTSYRHQVLAPLRWAGTLADADRGPGA